MECDSINMHPAVYVPISQLSRLQHTSFGVPKSNKISKMVRVIGKQSWYEFSSSRLLLQDCEAPAYTLILDMSRIEPFSCQRDCLCLFIGEPSIETVNSKDTLVLKVLLHRYVKKLNMNIYCKAHAFRLAYLKM